MSSPNLIHCQDDGREMTVSFSGEHFNRTETSTEIGVMVCRLIEESTARPSQPLQHLVIDCQRIDRVASVGLNRLIRINRKARSHGVSLVLQDVQVSVRELFAVTRMERMFDFQNG